MCSIVLLPGRKLACSFLSFDSTPLRLLSITILPRTLLTTDSNVIPCHSVFNTDVLNFLLTRVWSIWFFVFCSSIGWQPGLLMSLQSLWGKTVPVITISLEIADFFLSFTIIINRAQSVFPITLPRPLTRFPTFVIISPVELLIHDCVPAQLLLVVFQASCRVANLFLTRLKLIWPRSSLKTTKMSKNAFLTKSSRGQWVKTSIFLAYFRDSGKRNLDFRAPWFPILFGSWTVPETPLYDPRKMTFGF